MRGLALLVALLAGLPWAAAAHPHVFIEQRVIVLLGNTGPEALRIEWSFDELYSASLIADFLGNKKAPPTAKQTQAIEREAFASAAQVNYFLVLKLDDKPAKVGPHRDFAVDLDGPKLRYRFTVPLPTEGATRLAVNSLDAEWFIDFFLAKSDPIRIEPAITTSAGCAVTTEPQKTVLGMVDTQVAVCHWPAR